MLLVKRLAAISAKLASIKSNRDDKLRELLSEVVLAPTFQLPLSPYMVSVSYTHLTLPTICSV